jgi:uncharacterized protein (TIGR02453 family)
MASSFPGFSRAALTFFKQLEKNNEREWFAARKQKFEELLRKPMLELLALVNDDLRGFAVDHVTEPARALYRIHRDTRFSKDKTPYKTHIAAMFPRQGLGKNTCAGFYFGVSHSGVEVAAGMYMPGPPDLLTVRDAIAADEKGFRKLLAAPKLKRVMGEIQGQRLARVPKGFDPNHTAADLVRLKQFYLYVTLPADTALTKDIRRAVVDRFRLMEPMVRFINDAVLRKLREQEQGEETRPKRPEPMF